MGSKQSLSNGNEPQELTDMVVAFEQYQSVEIIVRMQTEVHKGALDVKLTATARNIPRVESAPARWDCVSVTCWGHEYKMMMGLLTSLLYKLDFAIAEKEFEGTKV